MNDSFPTMYNLSKSDNTPFDEEVMSNIRFSRSVSVSECVISCILLLPKEGKGDGLSLPPVNSFNNVNDSSLVKSVDLKR